MKQGDRLVKARTIGDLMKEYLHAGNGELLLNEVFEVMKNHPSATNDYRKVGSKRLGQEVDPKKKSRGLEVESAQ